MMLREITLHWYLEDVLAERPDLTEAQASQVLEYLLVTHDACLGINWEVINSVCEQLFPEVVSEEKDAPDS